MVNMEEIAELLNRALAEISQGIERMAEAVTDATRRIARLLSKGKARRVRSRQAFAFDMRRHRMARTAAKHARAPVTAMRCRRPGNGRQGRREVRKRQA